MKLSEIKEVYSIVKEDLYYTNWTLKQNVNEFIEFIEEQKDIKEIWDRSNKKSFPYCLDELYLEYIEYEGFTEEEEVEIIMPLDLKGQWQEDLEIYLQQAL